MIDAATFSAERDDLPALRNALSHFAALGYSESGICNRLGLANIDDLQWQALPIFRDERLAQRDALASAIDLFFLQGSIPLDECDRLFCAADRQALVRAGLLWTHEDGLVGARASLYPVGDSLIFSDHAWPMLPNPGWTSAPSDHVMFVGRDSRWLARATVRRPFGATLDLCTGSGVQALLAARHSERVVAVDINARAVRCATLNAQASGAANVQAVGGDLYEPVADQCFDLITANPPFVPSPVNSLRFRDGGPSGDDLQRRIISGFPRHLAPGGIAQMVTEFGESDEQPFTERLREWLGGAPMDIYIVRLREHSAASYAIGHADGNDTFGTFLESVRQWAGNLRGQGYSRIVSVLLAFQWSDPAAGAPWTRSEEAQPPHGNAGGEIEAAFRRERLLRNAGFRDQLQQGWLRRAGPIGLLEARVLGGDIPASTQARLMGKALPISHTLGPVERDLLALVAKPIPFQELVANARAQGFDQEAVFAASTSLLEWGLLLLSQGVEAR